MPGGPSARAALLAAALAAATLALAATALAIAAAAPTLAAAALTAALAAAISTPFPAFDDSDVLTESDFNLFDADHFP